MNDFYDFSDLRLGMRINAEGSWDPAAGMRVAMISIKDDGDADELEANIESIDAPNGTLRILGLTVAVGAGLEIKDLDKSPIGLTALSAGTRIKLKGRVQADRSFIADKIKVKMHSPDEHDEIEAEITALDPATRTLVVMGFAFDCDADVEIEA
jgi:hypothetical protein